MNKRDETRLREMLDAAREAHEYTLGRTRESLNHERSIARALERTIEIVGEAGSRVSAETRQQFPQIDWKNIVGMRNIIVHDYLKVDYDVVWDVAANQLPELIAQLEAILPPFVDEEIESNPDDV
jgi:uncharacterized protein with HEPN domain